VKGRPVSATSPPFATAKSADAAMQRVVLEHDPEKCAAVFRKDHA
jgi:hypothetical protein